MKEIKALIKEMRNSHLTRFGQFSMITEIEHHGLEGRGLSVNFAMPLNCRMLPGFPLMKGTLDLDLMLQSARSWVRYHMLGG